MSRKVTKNISVAKLFFSSIFLCPPPPTPMKGSGDILIFPLRLSVTKSCPLYNLKMVRDISTKLHTFVKHIQTMCHAQKHNSALDCLEFSSFDHFQCYFVSSLKLISVRGISTKLNTFVKHIQMTCHAQEPYLCFGYF